MDGWGSLTMLIKRQEAAKNRKANLRYDLQKRRARFLKENAGQELEFPVISNADMKILKKEIRKKHKAQRIKISIINILILTSVISLFYYIWTHKK